MSDQTIRPEQAGRDQEENNEATNKEKSPNIDLTVSSKVSQEQQAQLEEQPLDLLTSQVSDLNTRVQNATSVTVAAGQHAQNAQSDGQTAVFSQLLSEMANLNKNLQAIAQGQHVLMERVISKEETAGPPGARKTSGSAGNTEKPDKIENETVPSNKPAKSWTDLFDTVASYFPGNDDNTCKNQSTKDCDEPETPLKVPPKKKTIRSEPDPEMHPIFPYTLLQESVQDNIVFFENDLDQLTEQKLKIEKFRDARQWRELISEFHICLKTSQRLTSVIRNLHGTYQKVSRCDLPLFCADVEEFLQKGANCVTDVLRVQYNRKVEPLADTVAELAQDTENDDINTNVDESQSEDVKTPEVTSGDQRSQAVDSTLQNTSGCKPLDNEYKKSRDDLNVNLMKLKSLITKLALLINNPQRPEGSETPEDDSDANDTEQPKANEEMGVLNDATKTKRLRSAFLPVAGALLGGVMAGPLGIVAGAKIGGIAAVTGSLAGLGGGHLLKKKHEQDSTQDQSMGENMQPDVLPTPALHGGTENNEEFTNNEQLFD